MNITVLNIIMQMGQRVYQTEKHTRAVNGVLEGPPRRNSLVSERSGWSFPIMQMPIKSFLVIMRN